ncbi:MAG: tetratricopeptide repeat protein, partial [Chlamydiales bacterium]
MFITIVILTIGFIVYLAFHNWVQPSSSKSIQKNLNKVSQHISLEKWAQASKELTPLLEKGKGGKNALLLHAQILRGTNFLDEALKVVTKGAHQYPEELLFRLEEGKILLQLGRAKEALKAFDVCNPIMRGESDGLALASALFHAGFPIPCLELIEPWLYKTQNGELFALAGDAYFEQKAFRKAITSYHQALHLGFKTHKIFIQLGHAYRRLGNLAEGEKIFRQLLEKNPLDVSAALGVGACLQERKHYHKAMLFYQSSEAWEAKDPLLLKQAAICALHTKKYSFAEYYCWELVQKEKS